MVLALLEVTQFVADAFLDEDAARVLLHDGLFILYIVSLSGRLLTGTYLEDGFLDLLNLTRLSCPTRPRAQVL